MGDCRSHSWSVTNGPFFKSLLKNCYLQIEPCPTDKQKERECYLLSLPQCQILNSQQSHSLDWIGFTFGYGVSTALRDETSICWPKLLWLSDCQVLSLSNSGHNNPLFGNTCANMFPKIMDACQQEQNHAQNMKRLAWGAPCSQTSTPPMCSRLEFSHFQWTVLFVHTTLSTSSSDVFCLVLLFHPSCYAFLEESSCNYN